MLDIQDKPYFEEVLSFADEVGLRKQLDKKLKYLDEYAEHGERGRTRCRLYRDGAPYSFGFVLEKRDADGQYSHLFTGGLIFHGAHDNGGDGSYPTLTVSLTPTVGWSIHT